MSEDAPTAPAPTVVEEGITEIAPGVWVIPDRRVPLVPNVGIVVGDDAVLVVDTAMGPANGSRVLAAAKEKAQGKRLLVTITHFHPEHGFGAQAFRNEATIVYNRAQRDELHDKGAGYVELFRTFGPAVSAALEGVELVEPDEVYDGETTELDLGGRTVQLRTWAWPIRGATRSSSFPRSGSSSPATSSRSGSSPFTRTSRQTTRTWTGIAGSTSCAGSRS